ncbi:hypothetical protein KP803_11900 [Vibrio sp. ZSDE26]|uniref:Uncharacterized protein n=1 Tax=Vibrio amylolyticus TaxID=2847292 RepID=A0A9X1XL94_9VIBR|nr:hypothetical protein [Vibrio amylolyticus]MCK6263973.1 hypothetical protein [Vibrio amylolyticus]
MKKLLLAALITASFAASAETVTPEHVAHLDSKAKTSIGLTQNGGTITGSSAYLSGYTLNFKTDVSVNYSIDPQAADMKLYVSNALQMACNKIRNNSAMNQMVSRADNVHSIVVSYSYTGTNNLTASGSEVCITEG